MYLALRLVHILAAATWFAGTLTLASDVRRSLELGGTAARGMVDRVQRALLLSSAAGLGTLASGLGLIFFLGGFAHLPVRIHVGFGLSLVALAFEVSALAGAFRDVADAVTRENPDEARVAARRVAAFTGVLHLVRTVVLVLMVLRF